MDQNAADARKQAEIAVRRAVMEHRETEEIQTFVSMYGEDAFEEAICELIEKIASAKI